ncbi:24184_t:CDS:2 [Racocetra persica]|uniref:24184_t:CDS:1 n=1 Tax=Racocetra persica TaxID=160502 RepID=A0ACA9KU66_9GLOM|nr:24184_t:CDS:2 [Racocetra persica]
MKRSRFDTVSFKKYIPLHKLDNFDFTDSKVIGRGGFGVVVKSKWKDALEKPIAIKKNKDKEIIRNELKTLYMVYFGLSFGLSKRRGENRRTLIADFGLSKRRGETTDSCCGVPEYMDPRCFYNPSEYDQKSDMYSLGMILWEISSCRPPFQHLDKKAVILHILNGNKEIPVEGTPFQYVQLYQDCWGDPKNRPDAKSALKILCIISNQSKRELLCIA